LKRALSIRHLAAIVAIMRARELASWRVGELMTLASGVRLGGYEIIDVLGAGPSGREDGVMLAAGTKLGSYEIVSSLGVGGMGGPSLRDGSQKLEVRR